MSKEADASQWVLLNLSGYDYAMPLANAVAMMEGLSKAVHIENEYISGTGYKYYKSDKKPNVSIKLMDESQYLEAMINGYKPKKQPEF